MTDWDNIDKIEEEVIRISEEKAKIETTQSIRSNLSTLDKLNSIFNFDLPQVDKTIVDDEELAEESSTSYTVVTKPGLSISNESILGSEDKKNKTPLKQITKDVENNRKAQSASPVTETEDKFEYPRPNLTNGMFIASMVITFQSQFQWLQHLIIFNLYDCFLRIII